MLTADLAVAPGANGITVTASGVKAPTNVTTVVVTASQVGSAGSFAAGFNGTIGPVLLVPAVVNPSPDRPLVGIFVARSTGEQMAWSSASTATVQFQISIDGGATWSTQSSSTYEGVVGHNSYGGHYACGTFGPIAPGATEAANILQARMFMVCSVGGGMVQNSGNLDIRLMLSNS